MAMRQPMVWMLGGLSTLSCLGIIAMGDRSLAQDTQTPEDRPAVNDPRFTCELDNGRHTVTYSPQSQPGQSYPWAVPQDLGSAWPAERRCTEISRRLEAYRPDGLLELQTSVENGYDIVCVTTEANPSCRIVFTVPPGQDPVITRDRVFNNLLLADQGEATEGVTTFTDGGNILGDLGDVLGFPTSGTNIGRGNGDINLRPFLDTADGGTGTQLRSTPGRRLNPDNF